MLFIHESNLLNKIENNYKDKGSEIKEFYNEIYLPYKQKLLDLNYSLKDMNTFNKASSLIDNYIMEIENFSTKANISSQSKFRSTFIEEISTYLFKSLKIIESGKLGIYNKNVFSGLKINNKMELSTIYKDVDFCIGKKIHLNIDSTQNLDMIIPIICVEVKTYLDATMFNEVQFSSKQIKNASPNAQTYVLMEFNDVAPEKIISARADNNLTEMFTLRGGSRKENIIMNPISAKVLLDYYCEIEKNIKNIEKIESVEVPGRLLHPTIKKTDI